MTPHGRLAACDVLSSHNVPYLHWYEDALRHFGSRTVVFSLHILVESPREAATHLQSVGWVSAEVPLYAQTYYDASVDDYVVLRRDIDSDDNDRVILASASTWPGLTLPANGDHFPTLPQLYNALAQRFLDTADEGFRRYLSIQIGYLYTDCPQLASPEFIEELPFDVRQFHIDYRSETLQMTTPETVKHERTIRGRARNGTWELLPEGSATLGGTRVDRDLEAKLLAQMNQHSATYFVSADDLEGDEEDDDGADEEEEDEK